MLHTRLLENLGDLTRWSTDWQLTISAQKCFILHLGIQIIFIYTLNDSVIHAPAVVKDLGLTIDKELMFNTHINSIAHRAHYRAYAINKCFVSRDLSTLLRASTTYVCLLLEYVSPVWSPQSAGLITRKPSIEAGIRRNAICYSI